MRTPLYSVFPITKRDMPFVLSIWHQNPPRGLYFESEALRFAEFVRDQVPTGTLLHDVASFEAAMLVVGDRVDADDVSSATMHLRHDPREWLLEGPAQSAAGSFDVVVTAGDDGPNVQVIPCPGNCRTALP